jgi:RimJ/RimL family protein N-acetyltransferase
VAIRYLYDEQEEMREWAERKTPYGSTYRSDAVFIGIAFDKEIRAVAVFETFTDNDCMIHVVSDGSRRWLTREFLVRVFSYPFLQRKQTRVTTIVPASCAVAIRMNLRLGFVVEGRARKGMSDTEDILYMGILKEECNYLFGGQSHG